MNCFGRMPGFGGRVGYGFSARHMRTSGVQSDLMLYGVGPTVTVMRHIPMGARLILTLVTACLAVLAVGTAQAQFSMSRSEVERQSRLEWLNMKRSLSRPADPRKIGRAHV